MHRLAAALVLAFCRRVRGGPAVEPATLVLQGGTIITVEEARPDAQALAARGGRIVAIGSAEDVERYIGPQTEVIDLAGLTAVPGLIDSHAHFMGLGRALQVLELRDAATWDEIVSMVREAAARAKPGEWIQGRGWHQEKWTSVAAAGRRGFPGARHADECVAEQPGVPRARQRPCRLRERQGARRRWYQRGDEKPSRRRDPEGSRRAVPRACCVRRRPTSPNGRWRTGWRAARPRNRRRTPGGRSSWQLTRACATGSRRFTMPGRASPRSTC